MDTSKDYYAVLGVLNSAESEVIAAAFRALANKHHPDKRRGNQSEATSRMRELNEAHEVLSDCEKRRQYDEIRNTAAKGGTTQRPNNGASKSGSKNPTTPVENPRWGIGRIMLVLVFSVAVPFAMRSLFVSGQTAPQSAPTSAVQSLGPALPPGFEIDYVPPPQGHNATQPAPASPQGHNATQPAPASAVHGLGPQFQIAFQSKCLPAQKRAPEKRGLSDEVLIQYCSCMASHIADAFTVAEVKNIDLKGLTREDQTRMNAIAASCIEPLLGPSQPPQAQVSAALPVVNAEQPARWFDKFLGGWADDINDCRTAPIQVSATDARSNARVCEFKSTRREDDGWRVQAVCTADGVATPSSFKLTISDGRLNWSSEGVTRSYARCPTQEARRPPSAQELEQFMGLEYAARPRVKGMLPPGVELDDAGQ
jgi:curved DNA-binding protein CbpA